MASKVSAFESLRVLTLPDVRVALWIKLEIEPALLLKNGWKPWIVAPVRFHDHRIVWLLLAQKFIDGVLLPAWVPVGPQFRSFLSDRGAQQCQAARTQGLRFLHPRNVETFERLDRFRIVGTAFRAASATILSRRLTKNASPVITSAPTSCSTSVAKATSISCSVLAFRTIRLSPRVRTVACASLVSDSALGNFGFARNAIVLALGTKSCSSSKRFDPTMALNVLTPVILPPGLFRLATRLNLTGSSPVRKTIGIIVVAALAACAATPLAKITAT